MLNFAACYDQNIPKAGVFRCYPAAIHFRIQHFLREIRAASAAGLSGGIIVPAKSSVLLFSRKEEDSLLKTSTSYSLWSWEQLFLPAQLTAGAGYCGGGHRYCSLLCAGAVQEEEEQEYGLNFPQQFIAGPLWE